MAEHHVKFEITPRVVDLGDRVFQLQHVVSVGRHTVHPFRPLGLAVMVVGLGLIGNEAFFRGVDAFALQSAGSLPLWVAFVALGVSLFLLLYVRRVLSIQTSDGRRAELSSVSEEAATDVILRIRHAMEAADGMSVAHKPAHGPAAVQSGAEGTPPAHRATPAGQPHHDTGAAGRSPLSSPAAGDLAGTRTVPAGRHGGAYANGHAGGSALSSGAAVPEGGSITDQAVQAYRRAGGGTAPPQQKEQSAAPERRLTGPETAGAAAAGRDPLSGTAALPPGFARADGAQDLHAVMEHVRRSDVQHKEALLDLLRVVEDHYRGRASRDDALAHWRSFADYAVQYLGDVDGLIAHTERFGRHMIGR
ncbi:MAG: DUF6232 family protein [Hyphomicrobiaceae bacterium]